MRKLGFWERRRARKSFHALAGRDRLIDYGEWKRALGIQNDLFARRLFELVDADGSGFVDGEEFLAFARLVRGGSLEERLSFVFDVYDLGADGEFDRKEVRQVVEASLAEQGLSLEEAVTGKLVDAFLRKADGDKDRRITKPAFVAMAKEYPRTAAQLDAFAALWLGSTRRQRKGALPGAPLMARLRRAFASRAAEYVWVGVYVAGNAALAAEAVARYAAAGAPLAVQIARAAGACLNLNVALILLPMCRCLWSWLRHTPAARLVPIDGMTHVHRLVGYAIIALSLVHTVAHIVNTWTMRQSLLEQMFVAPTGVTGMAMLLALYLVLRGFHDKSANREFFSASHLLYGAFLAALLLHAPGVWMWIAAPLSLYALDALWRALFRRRRLRIVSLTPLADGVTSVVLEKPKRLRFFPGDYLRLQIPRLSRWQWHPFTISAAPETSRIAVHVRNNGDWSGALHNLSRAKGREERSMTARIDGPYGAPTSGVYRSPVAILVAGGIGVTPFASVLHSLLLRPKDDGEQEQTIHFHWLNRSQKSYEWFVDLLGRAERQLGESRFRLHIHLTSLSHNLSNIAMQMAVDAYRERHGRDPLTQLQAVTSGGRPSWDRILADVAREHGYAPVTVYFCGPPELGRALRRAAAKFAFGFREEKFD